MNGRKQGSDRYMGSKPQGHGENKAGGETGTGGCLYIVATPIGNASDITLRALEVLGAVDLIVCEDTRVTSKLLAIHGIRKPLQAYHEHNARQVRPLLLDRLAAGEELALVSDAGMPMVSDPGYRLAGDCIDRDIPFTVLPGATAPVTALALSGLPSDRFLFAGFAPPKTAARKTWLGEFAAVPATLLFFESARRLAAALADMADVFGPRPAAVTRELTKKFEEVRRGTLAELAAHYQESGPPKGEIVVVVGPPDPDADDAGVDLDEALAEAMTGASLRDAVDAVTARTGRPRREVYERALALRDRD
jgi:16S rRNA (cytidine1402-2'-O)-methyltransferase